MTDQNTRPTPSSDVEEATREAERLARILHKKHFPEVPQWEPLSGDLLGLLSQIDNMTTALSAPPAQVEVTDEMVRLAHAEYHKVLGDKNRSDPMRAALTAALTATDAKPACPVCNEIFRPDDQCATDIELGTCHAECLEGTPTVDLNTGEPVDGPIPTYRYGDDAKPVVPAEPVAGWKMVPFEPDDAMIEAGQEEIACRKQHGMQVFASDIYEAMVAAAPAHPLASEGKTDA